MLAITAIPIQPARLRRSNLWAISILAGFNTLDIITTFLCLRAGADEGNPMAKFLLEHNLLWPLKIWLTVSTVALVLSGDAMKRWWADHRPVFVIKFKTAWEQVRPSWLPRIPEPNPLVMHNLAWFVCGVYALVVVLNTLTYISLIT